MFSFRKSKPEKTLVINRVRPDERQRGLNHRVCRKIYEHEPDKDWWVLPDAVWHEINVGDVYIIEKNQGFLQRWGTLEDLLDRDEKNANLLNKLARNINEARYEQRDFSMMSANVREISGRASVEAALPGVEISANATSAFMFAEAHEAVFKGTDVEIRNYGFIKPLEDLMTREENAHRLKNCLVVSHVKIVHGDCTMLSSTGNTAHALLEAGAAVPVGAIPIVACGSFGGTYLCDRRSVSVLNNPRDGGRKATRAVLYRLSEGGKKKAPSSTTVGTRVGSAPPGPSHSRRDEQDDRIETDSTHGSDKGSMFTDSDVEHYEAVGEQKEKALRIEIAPPSLLYNSVDQYVKLQVHNVLKRSEEDPVVLRNKDVKAVRDELRSWQQSNEPVDSEIGEDRLKVISEQAVSCFNALQDPSDKLAVAFIIIVAEYVQVALAESPPNWLAGKIKSQEVLKQCMDIVKPHQWTEVAKQEVDASVEQRLAQSYDTLTSMVLELVPTSANANNPQFVNDEHATIEWLISRHDYREDDLISHHDYREDDSKKPYKQTPTRASGKLPTYPTLNEFFTDSEHVIATLVGHKSDVSCCAVYAYNTQAISGGWDKKLKGWYLFDGDEPYNLEGHKGGVTCCAIFANDTQVISGSSDCTLKVWDLTNGKKLYTLRGHTYVVTCCAVFASDTKVISGSDDTTLKVWDLTNGKELYNLEGHTSSVRCCAVFAEDTQVISGSQDGILKVWDLTNGQELYTLEGHALSVNCCAVFANGTRAISGSLDKTLKVWALENNGKELYTLEGHERNVNCCAMFANDAQVISGSDDYTLKVWDLTNQQELYTLVGHTGWVTCCAIYANDTRVISGSSDGTLKVWLLPSNE